MKLDYCEKLGRLFVAERVFITDIFPADKECAEHCASYIEKIDEAQSKVAGCFGVEIDARFTRVRTEETAIGNMLADLFRSQMGTDFGFINGGCIRADKVYPKGHVTKKFISECFPIADGLETREITGQILLDILQSAVSAYPKYEGRFPCVSGFKFSFDPSKAPGERVLPESLLMTDGTPVVMDKYYSITTSKFVAKGKDGFEAFNDPSVKNLCQPEDLHYSTSNVLMHFMCNFSKSDKRMEELKNTKYYQIHL